jgi:tetratricopeptide (TPR) repeat protein
MPDGSKIFRFASKKVGDVEVAQKNLSDGLASYRAALTIREHLAKADPSNGDWQRNLSISYERNVESAQQDPQAALASYRSCLAVRELLVRTNPDNTIWQRELATAYNEIGDVEMAQGKPQDALASYRAGLTVRERLAETAPENTDWQYSLAFSYNRIGNAQRQQGDLQGALASYRSTLAIIQRLVSLDGGNRQWQTDLQTMIGKIGSLAYNFLLAGDFAPALEAADQAISLAPDKIWLYTNRAHALMFLGRHDEARALYLKYRGEKNVQGDKSWETVILEDFDGLRKNGLKNPLMDEVEKTFTARG